MTEIFRVVVGVLVLTGLFFFIGSLIKREQWRTHMIWLPMGNLGGLIMAAGILLRDPFTMIGIYAGTVIVLAGVYIAKRRSKAAGLG